MAFIEKYKGRVPTFNGRYRDFILDGFYSSGSYNLTFDPNFIYQATGNFQDEFPPVMPVSGQMSKMMYNSSLNKIYQCSYNTGNGLMEYNGTSWTSRTIPFGVNSRMYACAYNSELNRMVAFQYKGNQVCYSTNGTSWTTGSGITSNIYDVISLGNSGFLAVGNGNNIHTSTDGISWSATSSNISVANTYRLHYKSSTNQIVGVGNQGIWYATASTPNVVTNVSVTNALWFNCIWVERLGLWILCSSSYDPATFDGTGVDLNQNVIMTSPNLTTWTLRTSAASYASDIADNGYTLFVVTGNAFAASSVNNAYSYNGINWTANRALQTNNKKTIRRFVMSCKKI